MVLVVNQVINGLMLGTMYALIASGFSLLFGVLNVVQFAHADVCFFGAFVSMAIITFLSKIEFFPIWLVIFLTLIFTVTITGLIGTVIEKICVKPFRKSPGLITL